MIAARARRLKSLPHACEGVSFNFAAFFEAEESSPCAWGVFLSVSCSRTNAVSLPHARGGVSGLSSWCIECSKVFPMHVGVFLSTMRQSKYWKRLPHARGGVSQGKRTAWVTLVSSPCAWGCFCLSRHDQCNGRVFPMHVGVFLDMQ